MPDNPPLGIDSKQWKYYRMGHKAHSDGLPKTAATVFFMPADRSWWYAGKVGERVPYLGEWPESGYKSIDLNGYPNVVKFDDAVIEVDAGE